MLPSDQSEVQKIVKKSGSSFYWGMKVLPSSQMRAMFSIYAYCRTVDDIADDIKDKKLRQRLLTEWENKINKIFKKKVFESALERELKISIEKFDLKKNDFLSIIKGMKMDSDNTIVFPSKKKLNQYCDRVAVAVGYLSIRIFGLTDSAKEYALYLGRAFQLTNIVRDFGEDLDRGRCYISKDYLEKYSIRKDMNVLVKSPSLQKLLQDVLEDAETYFNKAKRETLELDKNKILAPELMKLFYYKIFKKMYAKDISIQEKVRLSVWDKLIILLNFFVRKIGY